MQRGAKNQYTTIIQGTGLQAHQSKPQVTLSPQQTKTLPQAQLRKESRKKDKRAGKKPMHFTLMP
jgi:hypothetical protein